MEETKKKQNPKREELIKLSNEAKQIRENMAEGATSENEVLFWTSRTINYMLLNHMYEKGGATEFNTFNQWKEKGATIIKGSKAFAVWGQPIGRQKQQEAEAKGDQEEDDSNFDFFPICYLFSNKQVITAEEQEAEKTKRKEDQKKRQQKQKKIETLQTVELD